MTILFEPSRQTAEALAFAIGGEVATADSLHTLTRLLTDRPNEILVVVGPGAEVGSALEFAEEARTDRPALGVVVVRHRVEAADLVRALRAGVREVVQADDLPGLAAACARSQEVSHQLIRSTGSQVSARPTRRGRVVTVFSGKGGAGKTTMSTNVAAQLADGGKRKVCVIDLDLQFGDLAIVLQLEPTHTIVEAQSMEGHMDEAALRALLVNHSPGLDTLLAPVDPSESERITPGLVDDIIRTLTTMYDVVVVDTPPSFTDHVLVALDRTDMLLLVATPDLPSVKNLRLTIDMIRLLGMPESSRMIVLNRAASDVGVTSEDVERLSKTKIAVHVPSSRDVPISINHGEILSLSQPKHRVSQALHTFVTEHFESPVDATAKNGRRQRAGLFGRRKVATV